MQYRHRNSRDGRRSSRPNYENFGRGEVGNGVTRRPYHHPVHRRKEEILMKAGRLAAEYLVSEGLLPPSSIRTKWEDKNRRVDEDGGFKKRDRDHRRKHGDDDDYDDRMRRRRRRNDGYVSDWGHYDDVGGGDRRRRFRNRHVRREEIEKKGSSRSRKQNRGARDLDFNRVVVGEDGVKNPKFGDKDDDVESYESGEVREDDRCEGFFDSQPFENEGDGKDGNDLLAQRGEGCSSDSRELPVGYSFDLNKVAGGGGLESDNDMDTSDGELKGENLCGEGESSSESDSDMNVSDVVLRGKSLCEESEGSSESDGEVKLDMNDDSKGKNLSGDFAAAESYDISMHGLDLSKPCGFANVPTKPRTVGRRSSKIAPLFAINESKIVEVGSVVPKVNVGEDLVGGFSIDSHMEQTNTSKGEEYAVSSVTPTRYVEECVEQQQELIQSPASLGSCRQTVNANEKIQLVGQPQKLEVERLSMDEELAMGCVVDQEKPDPDDLFPNLEAELNFKMKEEKHLPIIYKVCDLNLMAPPEIVEAQNDLVLDHLHISVPLCEASKELPVGYPTIMDNLEDDSSPVSNAYDSLEPKSETTDSSLGNLTENADLQGAYNGCFPAISEVHQTDIFGWLLGPPHLNNTQAGMGIPGAEVLGRFKTS